MAQRFIKSSFKNLLLLLFFESDTTELVSALLQRVGGRYPFIHKLLQDHFAQMEFGRD